MIRFRTPSADQELAAELRRQSRALLARAVAVTFLLLLVALLRLLG